MVMLLVLANLFGVAAARRSAHLWRGQFRTRQILTMSVRDALTGAFNRRHLNAGLPDGEIGRARDRAHQVRACAWEATETARAA